MSKSNFGGLLKPMLCITSAKEFFIVQTFHTLASFMIQGLNGAKGGGTFENSIVTELQTMNGAS